MKPMRRLTGFTLIELAIVLVILGFVGTILVPPIVTSIRHEKRQENKDALIALRHAVVGWSRASQTLPAALPADLPQRDTWTREYEYKRGVTGDICAASTSTLEVKLNTNSTDIIKPAFLIASHGADTTKDVQYNATPIDISNPEDDIIEYMSLDHLKYLVCGGNDGPGGGGFDGRYVLYSVGGLVVNQNSDVSGDIGSQGSITIEQNVDVEGIYAAGSVSLRQNTSTKTIISNGAIEIAQNVDVNGDVHAQGSITIAQNSEIMGNVYAGGSVHILGKVHGNVYAGGSVQIVNPGTVLGSVQQNIGTPVPGLKKYTPPTAPPLQSFASIGPDKTIDESATLPPGNYGRLTIKENKELTLSSGSYVFKSINTENNVEVKINFISDQDLSIFVEDDADFGKAAFLYSTDGGAFKELEASDTEIAKRVFVETHEDFNFGGDVWAGGVLAQKDIVLSGKTFLGQAISLTQFSLPSNIAYIYVPSNFSQTHW